MFKEYKNIIEGVLIAVAITSVIVVLYISIEQIINTNSNFTITQTENYTGYFSDYSLTSNLSMTSGFSGIYFSADEDIKNKRDVLYGYLWGLETFARNQDDSPVHLFVSIEYNGTRYEKNYSTNNYLALPNGNDCLDKEENYCFIKWS